MRIHRVLCLFLMLAVLAAPGCKSVKEKALKMINPEEKKEDAKPLPWYESRFVAYYKHNAETGALEIWRMDPDGGNRGLLVSMENHAGLTLNDVGPGKTMLAYSPGELKLYYTYKNGLFRYNPRLKVNERVRDVHGDRGGGIDWIWFISDYQKMIVHCAGASTGNADLKEYIQVNLKNGTQGKITPDDDNWDEYDFLSKQDFFYLGAKSEDDTYTAPGGSAYFAFESVGGAGGWPALVVTAMDGTRTRLTNGMQRVLSARWTPSGKALLFIPEEETAPYSRGRVFKFAPGDQAAQALSNAKFRFDYLLNMSKSEDVFYYHEPGAGIFRYDFKVPPALLVEGAAYPYLVEVDAR